MKAPHSLKRIMSHRLRTVCPHCLAVLETRVQPEPFSIRCGACGETNPWPLENGSAVDRSLNQAAPHENAMVGVKIPAALDSVFLPAIDGLSKHGVVLILTSLTVNLIWFALIGLPADALGGLWRELPDDVVGDAGLLAMALGGTALVGLLIAPVSAYSMIVLIRLALRIAREGDSDLASGTLKRIAAALRVPAMTVARLAVLFIAIGMLAMGTLLVGLIAIIILSLVLAPATATNVGVLGVGAILISILFILQWLLWPVIFFIADERTDLVSGISWGVRLAWHNRKLTVSLVTVYFVLATVGSMLFYIGQIVTTPLAVLPMAVGYLYMTGGQTNDELLSKPRYTSPTGR